MKDTGTVSVLAVYTLQIDLSGGIELCTGKAMLEKSKYTFFKTSASSSEANIFLSLHATVFIQGCA